MTGMDRQGYLDDMSNQSYLAKFGINGWAIDGHHFDPCPISGRCTRCSVRADLHPIGPIRKEVKK